MDFLIEKPVLVTGGAGFIGSWLSQELLRLGARVSILDIKEKPPKSEADYIQGDVRDQALVKSILQEKNIRTIFHLAAQAIVGEALKDPAEALDRNVKGTWNLLESVRLLKNDCNVIVASSDKAYGSHPVLPYKEDFALLGENPYDCSKSCADRIAQMYAKIYKLPVAITRCGNVYGGGDLNFSRLIPDTIRSVFYDKPPQIRSDGLYQRDYVFIKDIVSAYLCVAEALNKKNLGGEAFNFGNNKPLKAIEVVNNIIAYMGKPHLKPVILATAQYEIKDQYLDAGKAMKMFGWTPRFSFEQGIGETIGWYETFFKKI